ncbi:MAG: lysophospholipid acyltransferase family protein [Kiritimatiellae bacterium]|nr:lysophospholipid acyltransferase family protein [Kiritimatiellia bacterium]MDW8458416.1 lysophospholipid acyltransferase family protein [Verrucomicrobiota bacterium]
MASYLAYRVASILARAMPRGCAYWLGVRISDLYYALDAPARRAVESNLQRVFSYRGVVLSRDAKRGLARQTFRYFGKYIVDFFRDGGLGIEEVERRVSIEGRERLESAYASKRGVVLVTAHLGNWELGGAVLSALGYPIHAVEAPQRMPRLEKLLRRQRERRGVHIVHVGKSARVLLKRLREGHCVALLADRDFSGEHEETLFFGMATHLPRGAAWLAHRADSPILPVFLIRMVDDTYLLRIKPAIDPRESPSERATHERIRDALEEEISENPHQWFVFREFWKTDVPLAPSRRP